MRTELRAGVAIPGAWQRDVVLEAGEAYRVFLWVPPEPPPMAGHPVSYLFDGNAVFGTAAGIARLAAAGYGPSRAASSAIVGIGYPAEGPFDPTRRTMDLTPPGPASPPPRRDGLPWPSSGGANAFLDVIERLVKPLVANEFAVDSSRETLIGHSFGGLCALYCLFTRPTAFANYVAASPSIWWNDRTILAAERAFVKRAGRDGPLRLQLSVGSLEQAPEGPPSSDPYVRRLQDARMVDNAREMASRLATTPGLSVDFHIFDDETHGSVIPAALARGLRFAGAQPAL